MQVVAISSIKPNPSNPRLIKDDKFHKLVKSLKDFPEMASVRPIVVNQDMVILGGNMRFKAMKEAKWKEIPVEVVDWDEAKQREFIIKDNVGFGEWDWNELANVWDNEKLNEWGLDVGVFEGNLDEFFNQPQEEQKQDSGKITLEYTLEECERVKIELLKHGKTPEDAVFNLLGL